MNSWRYGQVPINEHTQYKVLPSGGLLPGFTDSKSHKSLAFSFDRD